MEQNNKITSTIQTIFEKPESGKETLPPQITLTIKYTPSPEFLQGLQCNPGDRDILFNIFSDELEKLKLKYV